MCIPLDIFSPFSRLSLTKDRMESAQPSSEKMRKDGKASNTSASGFTLDKPHHAKRQNPDGDELESPGK